MTSIISQPIDTIHTGQDVPTVKRITMDDGTLLVAADISGAGGAEITLDLFDLGSRRPEVAIYTTTLDKTVLVTALVTGGYWDLDDTGYNFLHVLDGDQFTNGGKYRAQYTFQADLGTPAFGKIVVVTEFHAEAVL